MLYQKITAKASSAQIPIKGNDIQVFLFEEYYIDMSYLIYEKNEHIGVNEFFRNLSLGNIDLGVDFSKHKNGTLFYPVFLYGAFKTGKANHIVIDSLKGEFIEHGLIKGFNLFESTTLLTDNTNLPFIEKGEGEVKGELFLIPHIQLLDSYYGVPDFFKREEVIVVVNGKEQKAFTYVSIMNSGKRKILSGVY